MSLTLGVGARKIPQSGGRCKRPRGSELAYSADDVERINASGKLVAAIGIESGYVIGKDLSLLAKYHELGGCYMTLAYGGQTTSPIRQRRAIPKKNRSTTA